ncbi:nicotinic acid mononucleotide adenyltransferase [Zobellia alginiliquefaciens]|uniref:nicotinic acid mononucleotide adenyltransferase n=1 Tax=Zobellia alginiliquefaciens TaxID=3032586 RepID=UPI0023E3CC0E|nr:nicotinic acid mononucleotide adenyltransferase [Zobellia alginiliquefaciens]
MKTKLLLTTIFAATLMTSCYTEVIVEDDYIDEPVYNTSQVLQSYDLWYVDINATSGNGEVPFLQRAFTVSFDRGIFYANNNIVGIGKTGNGFGIDVGYYNTVRGSVDIDHDIDGEWFLDVFAVSGNTIELYDARSDTSYYLKGYQVSNFDYDMLFYENIHYFLQEYNAWEKSYTSLEGALNEFDNENFLQFNPNNFRSSIDQVGTPLVNLQWDFEGDYSVYDTADDEMLKTLTLDYRSSSNDYFELYVINESTIELYHPSSRTVYEFRGKGYQEYLKAGKGAVEKKRKKTSNPFMNVKRSRDI